MEKLNVPLQTLNINLISHHVSYIDECEYVSLNCVIAMKFNDTMVNI